MGFAEDGKPALPSIWTPKSIAQFLFFGFTFAQSIYQPIQNAIHLQTIHSDMMISTFSTGSTISSILPLRTVILSESPLFLMISLAKNAISAFSTA
jgi:hypothetical protein